MCHGCKALCSSKQRSLYLVKYCTCAHSRVDNFGRTPLSLSGLFLPPILSLVVWNLEESQLCRQSVQPLTNFCLQALRGNTHTHTWLCVTDTHIRTHTLAQPDCHHQLVSVPHLWTVTRRCGSERSHSCLTDSRDQFPSAEHASGMKVFLQIVTKENSPTHLKIHIEMFNIIFSSVYLWFTTTERAPQAV